MTSHEAASATWAFLRIVAAPDLASPRELGKSESPASEATGCCAPARTGRKHGAYAVSRLPIWRPRAGSVQPGELWDDHMPRPVRARPSGGTYAPRQGSSLRAGRRSRPGSWARCQRCEICGRKAGSGCMPAGVFPVSRATGRCAPAHSAEKHLTACLDVASLAAPVPAQAP
jgi:hypothetical protein